MTILPMFKKCSACGKKYIWNPDVGQITCPYCHGIGHMKKSKGDTSTKNNPPQKAYVSHTAKRFSV